MVDIPFFIFAAACLSIPMILGIAASILIPRYRNDPRLFLSVMILCGITYGIVLLIECYNYSIFILGIVLLYLLWMLSGKGRASTSFLLKEFVNVVTPQPPEMFKNTHLITTDCFYIRTDYMHHLSSYCLNINHTNDGERLFREIEEFYLIPEMGADDFRRDLFVKIRTFINDCGERNKDPNYTIGKIHELLDEKIGLGIHSLLCELPTPLKGRGFRSNQ